MSEQKAFELRVVFSVIDKTVIAGTTRLEKLDFINFITDSEIDSSDLDKYCSHLDKKLSSKVEDREEIGKIFQNTILDIPQYNKLCDIYWRRRPFTRGSVKPLKSKVT
jgi:hypothetical protein